MKKIYNLLCLLFLSAPIVAQNSFTSFPATELKPPSNGTLSPVLNAAGDASSAPLLNIEQPRNHSGNLKAAQTVIGATTYDLQSNASMARRVFSNANLVSGVWTFSLSSNEAAPDRGTGYNVNSGLGWGSLPTSRIETTRQGWPSIDVSASGMEHIVSHQFTVDIRLVNRASAGSGTWTESIIPSLPGIVHAWPRMAVGGANGNTLHLIDITMPTGNGGFPVDGIDGLLTYSRSQDDGATWDIQHMTLPGVDSILYPGFGADSYHIDADGDNVAIVSGRIDTDLAIWKSSDNGSTWTKTVVMQWPLPGYDDINSITDVNGDGIADTVLTNDGKNTVLIDQNGMVHVWAGAMYVFDGVISDPISLFLSTDGLMYWNESMGSNPPVVIAQSPDRDGDGMLTYAADYVPRYGNGGATSQPSAGIDELGNLYVTYVTLMENTSSGNPSPGDFSYRNVFLIRSQDGGLTWSSPMNVSDSDFDEGVFPSLARDIESTSCIDMIWQQDGLPGIAVQAPDDNPILHPYGNNDIVHDCVLLASGINDLQKNENQINIFPNPASDLVNIDLSLVDADVSGIELYNYSGQLLALITSETIGNSDFISFSLEGYDAGLYLIKIQMNDGFITKKVLVN